LIIAVPSLVDGDPVRLGIKESRGRQAIPANDRRLELVAGAKEVDACLAGSRVRGHAACLIAVGRVGHDQVEVSHGGCRLSITGLVDVADVGENPCWLLRLGAAAGQVVSHGSFGIKGRDGNRGAEDTLDKERIGRRVCLWVSFVASDCVVSGRSESEAVGWKPSNVKMLLYSLIGCKLGGTYTLPGLSVQVHVWPTFTDTSDSETCTDAEIVSLEKGFP